MAEVSRKIHLFFQKEGVSEEAIYSLETALEEIVTNAVKYAFRKAKVHNIDVTASVNAKAAELVIENDGDVFDPTSVAEPDINRPLEKMPVGGLGIHLIRSLASGLEYRRENDRNRLRVWVDKV